MVSPPTEPMPDSARKTGGPISLAAAAAAIAVLGLIAVVGFSLWLAKGEAVFVRLAADAWASCF